MTFTFQCLLSILLMTMAQKFGRAFDVRAEIAKWNKMLNLEMQLNEKNREKAQNEAKSLGPIPAKSLGIDRNSENFVANASSKGTENKFGMGQNPYYNQARNGFGMNSNSRNSAYGYQQRNNFVRYPNQLRNVYGNQSANSFGMGANPVPNGYVNQPGMSPNKVNQGYDNRFGTGQNSINVDNPFIKLANEVQGYGNENQPPHNDQNNRGNFGNVFSQGNVAPQDNEPPYSFGFGPNHPNDQGNFGNVFNKENVAPQDNQPPCSFEFGHPLENVPNSNPGFQHGPAGGLIQMFKAQQGNNAFGPNMMGGQGNYQQGFSVGVNEKYHNSDRGSYQGSLFQRTNDKHYDGLSNFNAKRYGNRDNFYDPSNHVKPTDPNVNVQQTNGFMGIKPEDMKKSFNEFMAKMGMKASYLNAKSEEILKNPNMKQAYQNFMMARFGSLYPKNQKGDPLLNYHHNNVPATEEPLFKRVYDNNYEGITSKLGAGNTTDKRYKYFTINRDHPDEPLDEVHKKVLEQNKNVKANEDDLKDLFKFEKEKQAEYDRDLEYGRIKVKRDVQSENTLTKKPRRTHILDDIDKRCDELEKFAGINKYAGNSDETTEVAKKNTKKKSKRSCGGESIYYKELDKVKTGNKDDSYKIKSDIYKKKYEHDMDILNNKKDIDEQIYNNTQEGINFMSKDTASLTNTHILSRKIRQSENTDEIIADLNKKCDRYSRLPYNEIFPTLLKEFDRYKEEVYGIAYRKAYRVNGWSAFEFTVPDDPIDKLPQVFRHFKYVSKTRLEEFYFIYMLRLPKLLKINQRSKNIIARGFKEANLRQLQQYFNQECDIENDFNKFSKIIRSKIFNTYLEFEDRFNLESPGHFYLSTMPPFNKDPTAESDVNRLKDGLAK